MDIWILVIVLLVIAIIFFIASAFAKDGNNTELEKVINEQGEQIDHLQRQLRNLEADVFGGEMPVDKVEPLTAEEVYYPSEEKEPVVEPATSVDLDSEDIDIEEPEVINYQVSDRTREDIIRFYSQGYTLNEIAREVEEDQTTIQYIIEEYIENR
ncbi:hypothetical protein HZY91_03070 [Facklamia sp. DSM 111018]|uniref:Helix-turn-helix domain-containing protein n=1 Tax=Facklamia lactis TaxID=2749967 RepID=A0ABS0LPE3_9LACT|nr:helix-turn-helix domain-containing protein [Facklamia lactis]MBG9980070.1 hypothetical protein [Facklamia lactis]MBG9985872.1 hypothetical protein [Facklamia lactis]